MAKNRWQVSQKIPSWMFDRVLYIPQDHSFSACTKFFEKLEFFFGKFYVCTKLMIPSGIRFSNNNGKAIKKILFWKVPWLRTSHEKLLLKKLPYLNHFRHGKIKLAELDLTFSRSLSFPLFFGSKILLSEIWGTSNFLKVISRFDFLDFWFSWTSEYKVPRSTLMAVSTTWI